MKSAIAIPMGDPAGIGPEIIISALNNPEIYQKCSPVVIGNMEVLKQAKEILKSELELNEIEEPQNGRYEHGTINIISLENVNINHLKKGHVQAQCGRAAFDYIKKSVELAVTRKVKAIATTPINKESLNAAGVPHIGHTEILADLTEKENPLTMFEVKNMRIFFFTRHLSLKDAISQITRESISNSLIMCNRALQSIGIKQGKIAVAALNPHGGEGGMFGLEEIYEIKPGIEKARQNGVDIVGVVPADSVFHQALQGKYDAVLSLYHDQGHIAAKMTDFEKTISITLGLPFIRTSVDHGTAFDIAGKGVASSVSMEECIKLASKYAEHYSPNFLDC